MFLIVYGLSLSVSIKYDLQNKIIVPPNIFDTSVLINKYKWNFTAECCNKRIILQSWSRHFSARLTSRLP